MADHHEVADARPDGANGAEDVLAVGEVQRIVGLQQAGGDTQHLGEVIGGLARARGGADQDQVGNQAAFVEPLRHLLRFVVTLAAQRAFEVAHARILVGGGVANQREALELVSLHVRTWMRPSTSRTSKMRSGSYAGGLSASPVRSEKRAPCRGQTISQSSMGASSNGESSCVQRSSKA